MMDYQSIAQKFSAWVGAVLITVGTGASANPQGGVLAAGQASLSTHTVNGHNTFTINQQSQAAIINWQSFSIDAGELTQFIHPNADAATLNRVVGNNLSEIYGTLQANGSVYLINPNGIIVGANGTINTQRFIASTLDVSNAEFLDHIENGSPLNFVGDSNARIINLGHIEAMGGDVYLIAHKIENNGTIKADGHVGVGAGSHVTLLGANAGTGQDKLAVRVAADDANIDQAGLIEATQIELRAANNNPYALAINHTGISRANGVAEKEGRIILLAEGSAEVDGTFDASASTTGNGGFVETSATQHIRIADTVKIDTSAANGETGTWLIDPEDIEINSTSTIAGASLINASTIENNLATTNVVIETDDGMAGNGDITVNQAINHTANSSDLTLNADRHIAVNQAVNIGGDIHLNSSGDISGTGLLSATDINLTTDGVNGAIGSSAQAINLNASGTITANAANGTGGIFIGKQGDFDISNVVLDAGTGDATLTAINGNLSTGLSAFNFSGASLTLTTTEQASNNTAGDRNINIGTGGIAATGAALTLNSADDITVNGSINADSLVATAGTGQTGTHGADTATGLGVGGDGTSGEVGGAITVNAAINTANGLTLAAGAGGAGGNGGRGGDGSNIILEDKGNGGAGGQAGNGGDGGVITVNAALTAGTVVDVQMGAGGAGGTGGRGGDGLQQTGIPAPLTGNTYRNGGTGGAGGTGGDAGSLNVNVALNVKSANIHQGTGGDGGAGGEGGTPFIGNFSHLPGTPTELALGGQGGEGGQGGAGSDVTLISIQNANAITVQAGRGGNGGNGGQAGAGGLSVTDPTTTAANRGGHGGAAGAGGDLIVGQLISTAGNVTLLSGAGGTGGTGGTGASSTNRTSGFLPLFGGAGGNGGNGGQSGDIELGTVTAQAGNITLGLGAAGNGGAGGTGGAGADLFDQGVGTNPANGGVGGHGGNAAASLGQITLASVTSSGDVNVVATTGTVGNGGQGGAAGGNGSVAGSSGANGTATNTALSVIGSGAIAIHADGQISGLSNVTINAGSQDISIHAGSGDLQLQLLQGQNITLTAMGTGAAIGGMDAGSVQLNATGTITATASDGAGGIFLAKQGDLDLSTSSINSGTGDTELTAIDGSLSTGLSAFNFSGASLTLATTEQASNNTAGDRNITIGTGGIATTGAALTLNSADDITINGSINADSLLATAGDGVDGTDGLSSTVGGDGERGGDIRINASLNTNNGNLTLQSGHGGQGGRGGDGALNQVASASDGGAGARGGDIYVDAAVISVGDIQLLAGQGGLAKAGGRGGNGFGLNGFAGHGGDGGHGGHGGGVAINAALSANGNITVQAGGGGAGGNGGDAGYYLGGAQPGNGGNGGDGGSGGSLTLNAPVVAQNNVVISAQTGGLGGVKGEGDPDGVDGMTGVQGQFTGSQIDAASLAGNVTVNSVINPDAGGSVSLSAFNTLTLNPLQDITLTGAGDLFLQASNFSSGNSFSSEDGDITLISRSGDLTLANGFSANSIGAGNIVLLADNNLVNNTGGFNPLTVNAGRWLIYSQRPDQNTNAALADMSEDFVRYNTRFDSANPIPASLAAGNGMLFAVQPRLTGVAVTVNNQAIDYGQTFDSSDFSVGGAAPASFEVCDPTCGVINAADFGLPLPSSLNAADVELVLDPAVTLSNSGFVNAGSYADGLVAGFKQGTALGDLGIGISGAGDLNVNAVALVITANDDTKVSDGVAYNGGNGVSVEGFVNGDSLADLTGNLSFSGTSQGAVNEGSYSLSASGLSALNYMIRYVPGTLQIVAAPEVADSNEQQRSAANIFFAQQTLAMLDRSGKRREQLQGFGPRESRVIIERSSDDDAPAGAVGWVANY